MAGTWWCQKCKEAVISQRVTFQECHDTCGHPVEWVEYHVTLQEELTRAKDLVRRLAAKVDEWEMGWVAYYGDPTDDIDPDSADLLAEAEAMTKGEQP